jgi:hypothetical protein
MNAFTGRANDASDVFHDQATFPQSSSDGYRSRSGYCLLDECRPILRFPAVVRVKGVDAIMGALVLIMAGALIPLAGCARTPSPGYGAIDPYTGERVGGTNAYDLGAGKRLGPP